MQERTPQNTTSSNVSRRHFIGSSAAAALSLSPLAPVLSTRAYAAGSDEIKVGLIGCGGRGTGAVTQALMCSDTPVKLWAMAGLFRDELDKSYVQEHKNLIDNIRQGQALNEGIQVAESTMAAVAGRMSAYTGREFKWSWVMKQSKLDLSPPKYEFGDLPVRPIPVPGKTRLM